MSKDNRFPYGWWILPGAIIGGILWATIVWLALCTNAWASEPTTVWSSDGSISYRYEYPEGVEYEIESDGGDSKINWIIEDEASDPGLTEDETDLDN